MRRLLALCLGLVLTSGCTLSKVEQDATVTVTGRLLSPEGAPHSDTRVLLLREADLGDALLGFALITGSLGAICLVDEPPALCGKARRATTGADGRFSFEMRGRDTQGVTGTASTFYLSTSLGGGRDPRAPLLTARFRIQTTDLTVPDLRFWRPSVELSTSGGALRATWDGFGGDAEAERLVAFGGPDEAVVWAAEGDPPLTVDARVLEDARGTAAIEATTAVEGQDTTFRIVHRSGQVAYTGSAGPPPSRGRPCGDTPPCTATDGDLGPPEPTPAAGPVTAVTVDLGVARPVDLVVVRGCPATCTVETSNDGQTWAGAGSTSTPFGLVDPPARTAARSVRVTSQADLGRLAELSVW